MALSSKMSVQLASYLRKRLFDLVVVRYGVHIQYSLLRCISHCSYCERTEDVI